jgi:hypothetical protein
VVFEPTAQFPASDRPRRLIASRPTRSTPTATAARSTGSGWTGDLVKKFGGGGLGKLLG